jgi:hypothetical protein
MPVRRMVPVATLLFKGHRCEACGWSRALSRTVQSVKAANREAKQAFKVHGCLDYPVKGLRLEATGNGGLPEFFRKILDP